MSKALKESTIVAAVAKLAAKRIGRKVIADLQHMQHTLSGDDSELKTTWDEICAQVQYEQSFAWDAYDETVRATVGGYVIDLPTHEREAIWLQTEAGSDWNCEEPESRQTYPVVDDDIVKYITTEHVYVEAGRWSNARIRAYIERSSMRD
jgi:hypothetical protein